RKARAVNCGSVDDKNGGMEEEMGCIRPSWCEAYCRRHRDIGSFPEKVDRIITHHASGWRDPYRSGLAADEQCDGTLANTTRWRMLWGGQRESDNVEDLRGQGPFRPGLAIGGGGLLLVLVVSFLTGTNPLTLLNMIETGQEMTSSPPAAHAPASSAPPSDRLGKF